MGIWAHLKQYFWTHTSQPPSGHLDQFSRFCTVHPCVQHTHGHTDHATCDICRNRPHLCTVRRRCGLKTTSAEDHFGVLVRERQFWGRNRVYVEKDLWNRWVLRVIEFQMIRVVSGDSTEKDVTCEMMSVKKWRTEMRLAERTRELIPERKWWCNC